MLGLAAWAAWLCPAQWAAAEHPIEVQRLAAKGEYMKALVAYDAMPERRRTSQSAIAAGRSAWALGLNSRAIETFEDVLQDETLSNIDRGRTLLSRAIIEFQESRYSTSVLYAERAARQLESPSVLRAKVWLLWGQGLSRMNSWVPAEEKFEKALVEASSEDLGMVHFELGVVEEALGKNQEAKEHFEKVPLEHEKTPLAIRHLAMLALGESRFDEALFWLEKGRKDYRDSFLDSWVDYARVEAAIGLNDADKVRTVRVEAAKQYPPSDKWFNLLEAAAEGFEWKRLVGEGAQG